MQRADKKMVFWCNNLLQATYTGLSDITCCWLMHKLSPSPWCLVFIPCKLRLLKKKQRLMKLNIKMQKQNPQCPHCLQCVCSGLFLCYTQLRLLKRAKCVCYSDHFGFSVLSESQGSGAWGFGEGEVRNLLHSVWGCTETTPKGLVEGERKDAACRRQECVDMETCKHLPAVPECWLQEQQCWALCFWTPGLHLTSELCVGLPWHACCVLAGWICIWDQIPYTK